MDLSSGTRVCFAVALMWALCVEPEVSGEVNTKTPVCVYRYKFYVIKSVGVTNGAVDSGSGESCVSGQKHTCPP